MKKQLLSILTVASIMLSGCGDNSSESKKTDEVTAENPITLKFAGQFPKDSPISLAMEEIKKNVEEKSGGRLIINTYPANQLGDPNLVLEGIMDGSVQMGVLYNSSSFDPMIELNGLPYLTTNMDEVKKVYSQGSNYYGIYSDVFKKLNIKIMGIHVDGLIGIHSAEHPGNYLDLSEAKKLLVRIPASDIYKMTTMDMGYPTVTIAFSDIYTSLQTGVCDASMGQTVIGAYTGYRDVSKYFIPYRAFVECLDYMINIDTWNSLPKDLQDILQTAISTEVQKQFENVETLEAEYSQKLIENGFEILPITDEERAEMAKYIRNKTWPKLYEKFGEEVLNKILADVQQ